MEQQVQSLEELEQRSVLLGGRDLSGERDRAGELIDELLAEGFDRESIFGQGGLLAQLTKRLVERALQAELTAHLGYEPHAVEGRGSGNSRNGATPKMVHTDAGSIRLEVPRDRAGTFEPQLVPKGTNKLGNVSEKIIGMYASGMTVRDIAEQLRSWYGIDVSPDVISRVTDEVTAELQAWQSRPLDPVWPIIYLDALVVKVRDQGVVGNKAAHMAVGVDITGRKHVLGIWLETNEGAKFWLKVLNELRGRGIQDALIVVCDGLKGLPEAIGAVWPLAWVQTCIVHLVRNSLKLVSYKDRKQVAKDLKQIYRADSDEEAALMLCDFEAEWSLRYPGIARMWRDNWERVIPFLAFPPEIRKVVYTTNTIESINYQLRKVIKNRGHFPTDQAALKLLFLAVREMEKPGRRGLGVSGTYNWTAALNQFEIIFPGRLANQAKVS